MVAVKDRRRRAGAAAVRRGLRRLRGRLRPQRRPAGLRLPGPAAGQGPGRGRRAGAGRGRRVVGALGRLLPAAVALDPSAAQLRHNLAAGPPPGRRRAAAVPRRLLRRRRLRLRHQPLPDPAPRWPRWPGSPRWSGCSPGRGPRPPTTPAWRLSPRSWPAAPAATAPPPAGWPTSSASGSAPPAAVRSLLEGAGLLPTVAEVEIDSLAGGGRLRRLPAGHHRRGRPGRRPGGRAARPSPPSPPPARRPSLVVPAGAGGGPPLGRAQGDDQLATLQEGQAQVGRGGRRRCGRSRPGPGRAGRPGPAGRSEPTGGGDLAASSRWPRRARASLVLGRAGSWPLQQASAAGGSRRLASSAWRNSTRQR